MLSYLSVISTYSQIDPVEINTFLDSNINRNFNYTLFDNDYQSAILNSKINVYTQYKNFDAYFKNYYSSAVSKYTNKLFRDFDNIKTGIGYFINPEINIGINYTGKFYSDEKNINLKGTSSNQFYLSGTYDNSFSGINLFTKLTTGYKQEKQLDEFNTGVTFGGEMRVSNMNFSEYFVDGEMKFGYEDLEPRKNTLYHTKIEIDKSFSDGLANNQFEASFSRIRKDFYFPADNTTMNQFNIINNIEQRTEYLFRGFDRFDYQISKNLNFYFSITPYFRKILKENFYIPSSTVAVPSIYDTEIQELSATADVSLSFELGKIDLIMKISYFERDEQHLLINQDRLNYVFVKEKQELEAKKNNHSSRVKLSGQVFYSMNEKNTFELSGSSSLLKYDTPSNQNFDDRDELNLIVYLLHKYNNGDNFYLTTIADLKLYHTVYIYSQKSSNNNWNRVIRLSSRSVFSPSSFLTTINSFSVLANYTVYDFEDLLSTVKSYSFRQFNFKDSTTINLNKYFYINFYGELKLYERGELKWKDFLLRPLNYFEDRSLYAFLNYTPFEILTLSAGYQYFEQRRFNYLNGERIFDTFVRKVGPVSQVSIYLNTHSYLELVASYDYHQYEDPLQNTSNGNIYLNILWNF